jgi:hypothetical protein
LANILIYGLQPLTVDAINILIKRMSIMTYSGFEISKSTREMLSKHFPPMFADFIGHHVTWEFGVDPTLASLPTSTNLKVVGYCSDESLECLVVEYNGSTARPDGKLLHLTWSLDRSQGRKPVDSNKLLETTQFYPLSTAINIQGTPKFFK